MGRSIQIDTFNRFTQVSRETITSLIMYENLIIEANKSFNLIIKNSEFFILNPKDEAHLVLLKCKRISSSAICTVFSAAPLRKLSATTHKFKPLSTVGSERMRDT